MKVSVNSGNTIVVAGEVIQGHQVASGGAEDSPYPDGSIALQMPHFARLGLDLSDFYPGTLNVSIAPKSFELANADYRFEHLQWIDGFAPETFSFCRCNLIFAEVSRSALVYYPHPETKTQHFHNASLLEILAPKIDGIAYGDKVSLELNSNQFILS